MPPGTGPVVAVTVVVTGAGVVGGLVVLAVVVVVGGLTGLLVSGAAGMVGRAAAGVIVREGLLLMALKVLWLVMIGARVDFCFNPLEHVPENTF